MVSKSKVVVGLILGLALSSSISVAENFYRYRNEQGSVVVDFRIPTRYVKGGY